MKVLHVLQSNRFSGAENVVCQIIKMMQDEPGMEFVYASRDGQIREALKERGIAFEPIKEWSKEGVKAVVDKVNPDVIHAHDRGACVFSASCGKPMVAHMHVNNNKGFKTYLKNRLWKNKSKKYSHIFWVSESSFTGFPFHKALKDKSSVLYNVISREDLLRRVQLDEKEYDYDIAYVGRLTYQKHPERLMKVLSEVVEKKPDIKVAIVGNGDYADYVSGYIKEAKLEKNVDYLGYMNNPAKVLASSKILIMTSRFEGTPMVALEAQTLGLPIVSTPVDGLCDLIVSGENGYLESEDEKLVERCVELTTNADKLAEFKKKSLEKIAPYNDVVGFKKAIKEGYERALK
ncbi:MAG: glycosyltransferase [Clostridia bacterium]|nr:glycosyltransferase [Clostridia bacterium]